MAKYVLGEAAARKFRELTNGDGTVGRNRLAGHGLVFDDDFCDPFAVHYAASVRNGEGGFIVWLPTGHELTVDGQNVNVSVGLEAAGGDYPDGWYLIPSEIVPEDQGEFDLYIKIVRAEGAMTTAEFVTEKESGGEYVHVAKVARDQSTGAVSVRQTVRSAVVLGAGGGGGGGNDYFADEESLTLKRDDSTGPLVDYGTIFQIKGFGKHDDPSSATGKSGTYIPASESELSENPSSVAFLGRVGTGESGNQIGYFKLKVKGGGGQGDQVPTCFDYVPTYQQREGEEPVLVGAWIRKNYFYFDGKLVTIGDYQVKSSNVGVMLVGLQNAPTETNHNPTWSWSIREGTLPQKPDGGRLVYYYLYSLSNWKIQLDYRTTFLTVTSPHQVAHFEVARPDMVGGGNRVLLCAAGDEHAEMDVISKTGYGYLLNTELIPASAVDNIKPRTLKYGDTLKGIVLADRDIVIPQGSDPGPEPPEPTPGTDVTVVTNVELKMENGVLKIGLTKVTGKMTSVGTPVTTWTDGITAKKTDVVVSADYSTETQSFTVTPRKIYTLGEEADQAPSEVFKAIRHS